MTPVEQIKEKLDIAEFIRQYAELKPAGKNFKANCPFHKEKTPSFIVSPERQTWHCFGSCSEGGDIFKFLMKYENIEFYEALKILAEKAGVELKRTSPQDQKQFGVLYDINESAKDFFKKRLGQNSRGQKYFQERGLKPETIEEFELGMSPEGFDELTIHLINLGYDVKDIERAGLNFKSERGTYIDRFRNRLMFPVYNHFNKVAAFSGRILPELDNGETGKYVNSPETFIYSKSKILYGFSKSKNFIHQEREAVLVEGQMDFLMLWQSGIKNIAATSGTALTQEHLKSLKRQTENLVFCFDSDEAGLKAAERSIDLANGLDFNVKILTLKDYKDPAEAALSAADKLPQLIRSGKSAMDFYFERYLSGGSLGGETSGDSRGDFGKLKNSIRIILGKIKNLGSALERSRWLKELSSRVNISESALLEEMERINSNFSASASVSITANPSAFQPFNGSRWDLVAERLIILSHLNSGFNDKASECLGYFPEKYKTIFFKEDLLPQLPEEAQKIKERLESLSALESEKDVQLLSKEFDELIEQLKNESAKEKKKTLLEIIRKAERNKDEEKLSKALCEFDGLVKSGYTENS